MIPWLKRSKKFSTKVIGLLLFLSLGSLIVYGVLSLWINIHTFNTTLREANENYTTWAAREIYSYVESNIETLRSVVAILGKSNLNAHQQENTIRQINKKDDFNYLYLIDTAGKTLINTNPRKDIVDFSNDSLFQKGKKGETLSSQITINERSAYPQLLVALPVKSLTELQGVLIASINLRKMCDAMAAIKVGETGKAFAIDQRGVVILHKEPAAVVLKNEVTDKSLIETARQGRSAFFKTTNFNGNKVIGTITPIEKFNWSVIFEIDSEEAFAPAKKILMASLALILVTIGFSWWSGLRFTKSILVPIETLSNAMRTLARGERGMEIPVTTRDELGLLAKGFNSMTRELEVMEKKVRNIQDDLKHAERLSTIGTISSKILHEVRSPLLSLKFNLKCLLDSSRPRGEKEEASHNIGVLIERMEDVANNLLQFSKKRTFRIESYKVSEIFEELVILFKDQLQQRHVSLHLPSENNLPPINVDKSAAIHVFSNLIKNSIDAMPSGGNINVRHYSEDEFIVTEIQDTGAGIPKEKLAHIFDTFYTSKEEGTGLGLAIVQQSLKDLGGRIKIESEEGEGTTCRVFLLAQSQN